ncbi:MAG: adenylosuccinate lyase, partial [Alphaproteobacteria bacterium]|nr:adenylosuccinate lyase [Alphaproteobacteria bacterium]
SVERVIAPDTTILLDFALNRLNGVMDKLLVYPKRMKQNLEHLRGLVFSQPVLLALTQAGLSRNYAYLLVQEHAMAVWDSEKDFLALLLEDETVSEYISEDELRNIFNYRHCIERTADVIDRVLENH